MNRRPFIFAAVVLASLGISIGAHSLLATQPLKIEKGRKVTLGYKLFVEGALLEKADPENPFIYTHGEKQIVPGLEKNLFGLRVGNKKTIRVVPEEGYGLLDPKAYREFQKDQFPADVPLKVGTLVEARSPQGERLLVKIREIKEKSVILDFNHPLAGKELEFQVEVLNIV
jgi:FKBP-type peptidyl-prolyl cis-trans isomerase 2